MIKSLKSQSERRDEGGLLGPRGTLTDAELNGMNSVNDVYLTNPLWIIR